MPAYHSPAAMRSCGKRQCQAPVPYRTRQTQQTRATVPEQAGIWNE